MLKKLVLALLSLTIFVLTACSSGEMLPDVSVKIGGDARLETIDTLNVVVNDDNRLLLMNVLTDEVLNEFFLSGGETIWARQELENGYLGVFAASGLVDGFLILSEEEPEITKFLYILDHELDWISKFTLTSDYLIVNTHDALILFENEEWVIYYYNADERNIYRYQTSTNQTSLFFELDDDISIGRLQQVSERQIGFFANDWDFESLAFYYGQIDKQTNQLTLFEKELSDFEISEMFIYDDQALFTEHFGSDLKSKVLVLDLTIGDFRKIQLEGNESVSGHPRMIGNGRLIFTVNNTWFETDQIRLRVYDEQSTEVLSEKEISREDLNLAEHEELVFTNHIEIDETYSAFIIGISTWSNREFSLDNLRFFVEFVRIEEIGD